MEAILITINNNIMDRLGQLISTTQSNVTSSIHSTVIAAATLYFLMYGIATLRGTTGEPFMEIVIRGAKVAIVVALATNPALYNEWVVRPVFYDITNGIQQIFANGDAGIVGFAKMFSKVHDLAIDIYNKSSGVTEPLLAVVAGVAVTIVAAIYCGVGAALLIVVQIALGLLVALGPIFIGFFLFAPTRNWFSGWLGQVVNFLVLYLIVLGVGSLITSAILQTVPDTSNFNFSAFFNFALTAIAMLFLGAGSLVFLPGIAAGIAGGGRLDFLPGARMVTKTAKSARRQTADAARGARLVAGDVGRAAGRLASRRAA
ncbi:MAG: type IV secretion system protein [Inquilinus sp.]|uniref:type IV secretion system protein n=1 Tax=Inquilinus sp. TaxID=1932117 RepID=UPI003F2B13D6